MRSLTVCPVCSSSEMRQLYRFQPALWIPGTVVACAKCSTIYKIPVDTAKPLTDYYDQSYAQSDYWSQEQAAARALTKLADQVAGTVTTANPSLLDIGCGTGHFLSLAQERGFKVTGLELNATLAERARERTGAEVLASDFMSADLDGRQFDVVTMLDLIEHVGDPLLALRRCGELLKPGGWLVVYTPNHAGLIVRVANLLYRLSGGRIDKPIVEIFDCTHVTFFDVRTIRLIMKKAGMQVAKMVLLKYDPERSNQATGVSALAVRAIEAISPLVNGQFRILIFARK